MVMGMMAAAILVANNLRDLDTDSRAGKRTLAVMIGRERTRVLYTSVLLGSFGLVVAGPIAGITPPLTALAAMLVGFTAPLIRRARTATDPAALIGLLGGTARLQLLVGIALAVTAAV
jgi:1,4-dihydroxy-2-naphthoate octaprenyltransferase